ncbi:MAG: AMP-binding protein [Bradymonadaceae bacterium]|nr:AMP-binding protein [Lujinxingiaceae bacterium]
MDFVARTAVRGANRESKTLVELLRERASWAKQAPGYIFLNDGEADDSRMSFAEVDGRARAIGARLQAQMKPGDRALLLYPPSLEYVEAFFGCLYAGVVAVPAYPPDPSRLNRTLPRLQAIIKDAELDVVLTTGPLAQMAQFLFAGYGELERLVLIATDEVELELASSWKDPGVGQGDLAFLQYTSGSTGQPKGVMLSHQNLIYNSSLIQAGFGLDAHDVAMHWLPLYHDMGLIGAVLQPLHLGNTGVIMSPIDFLKRPFRWVQAMSRYKCNGTGAPNFAYDLAVRKTSLAERDTLDLSAWHVACNGAEPIRRETLQRFSDFFEPVGFRPTAHIPSYGLAECTLIVSAKPVASHPLSLELDRAALEDNRVELARPGRESAELMSCGILQGDFEVAIVDPHTRRRVGADGVGEIWLRGTSVARGYWNRAQLNEEIFCAYIAVSDEGPYFRSGDLGFMRNDEIFITGRHKDLIIIRGTNHYPQDIEWTVEATHASLRSGCGAAFSVDDGGEERLIIVHEVDVRDGLEVATLAPAVAGAVTASHDVSPAAVVLIAARSIDKTSSGKIQRRATRQAYLEDRLEVVYKWAPNAADPAQAERKVEAAAVASSPKVGLGGGHLSKPGRAIEAWLRTRLSEELGLKREAIDLGATFASLGMGSMEAVGLVGELERWLEVAIPVTTLYDHPTIEALARHLAGAGADASEINAQARPEAALGEPVALVGMGCRFPGAASPQAFWELLIAAREAVVEVPRDRWDIDAYYDAELSSFDTMNTRRAGFVDGVDTFDASFFGLSTREAAAMDPQQRLVLEVAWQALEDAAIAPAGLAGSRTGVFIGLSSHDFSLMQTAIPPRAGTGIAGSIAANRLSYLLDLRGPSMVVDTACSSSLVALDLGVQNLRLGRCDLALVGGVNVMLVPQMTIAFSQAGMMAPDGRCKTFDAAADGYVRGEGCGVVVLKRLSHALRDGDRVIAVIRGTAVNQDGQSNGLTAPNGLSQQAVIGEALADAGVLAADIGYVEAHGTGTELGDAIEVSSLNAVLGAGREADRPCYLASVKTNIGHLEAAAGIAGLIKAALVLSHGQMPAHLNVVVPSPKCAFEHTPFRIPSSTTAFEPFSKDGRSILRLAGVSSFGFGGTNAHVILEEAPIARKRLTTEADRQLQVLTISAKSPAALEASARGLDAWLSAHPEASLAEVASTLNVGRNHFGERLALVADSSASASAGLSSFLGGERSKSLYRGSAPAGKERVPLAFLFSGQGAQYPQMGRRLFETQASFRATLERCADIVDPYLSAPLLSVMFPSDANDVRIHQTAFAQPALFALEYALFEMWRGAGIEPDAVMGHSVGEYVAACVAGVIDLEVGLRLIAERGRLMQSLDEVGSMAVVFASEAEVSPALQSYEGSLSLAAINGPAQVVLSGESEALDSVLDALSEQGFLSQMLNVSHAFHSALMDPIVEQFQVFASQFNYRVAHINLVSNLTGEFVDLDHVCNENYWSRHIRAPVKFSQGMSALWTAGARDFVEIGPSPTLINLARRCVDKGEASFFASLDAQRDDWACVLEVAAKLHCQGTRVDWRGLDGLVGERLSLPSYPFERRRCWPKSTDVKSY